MDLAGSMLPLKIACIGYRSWKYWHAAKNHIMALAVITAYDFYLECCNEPQWRVEKPMPFHQFRCKLAEQMLCRETLASRYESKV